MPTYEKFGEYAGVRRISYVQVLYKLRGRCYEYAMYTPKIDKNIDSAAYASVLEKFSYVGIRWLNR